MEGKLRNTWNTVKVVEHLDTTKIELVTKHSIAGRDDRTKKTFTQEIGDKQGNITRARESQTSGRGILKEKQICDQGLQGEMNILEDMRLEMNMVEKNFKGGVNSQEKIK